MLKFLQSSNYFLTKKPHSLGCIFDFGFWFFGCKTETETETDSVSVFVKIGFGFVKSRLKTEPNRPG
jgi:hypothetical protein